MRVLFLFISALFLLQSCTEDIPFDLNEQGFDRLVVEGSITDQTKAHEVKLTKTTSFFDEEVVPVVSGAIVKISNSLDEWTLTENPSGSGRYFTPADAAGTAGLNHMLTIEADGETYQAQDFMYSVAPIDSIAVDPLEEDIDDLYWKIKLWTTETPNEKNFYRWRVLINGVTDNDSLKYSAFANDVGFDGAELEDYIIEAFEIEYMQTGDTITLEQHGISEDYFDMILALVEQTQSQGGLFDPPPANVPTNLSGGALGFFAASSVSEQFTVISE
jgi:hypothetical protein